MEERKGRTLKESREINSVARLKGHPPDFEVVCQYLSGGHLALNGAYKLSPSGLARSTREKWLSTATFTQLVFILLR